MATSNNTIVQAAIHKEYELYRTEVKILIDMVEVECNRTPDGILNDIKSFTGHIVDAALDKKASLDRRMGNIEDAHSHLRRVMLDCYKILCICSRKRIERFVKTHRFCDITAVDDGEFPTKLHDYTEKAKKAHKEAKKLERTGKNDIEDKAGLGLVYEAYRDTYNCYCDTLKYIEDHRKGIIRLTRKHIIKTIITAVVGGLLCKLGEMWITHWFK